MFVESFDNVTILFSDIVSYTSLAASLEPLEIVTMLNRVYRWASGPGCVAASHTALVLWVSARLAGGCGDVGSGDCQCRCRCHHGEGFLARHLPVPATAGALALHRQRFW